MSAIENSIVVSGHAHIEHEQRTDLGGEHRSPTGGSIRDVAGADVKQATDTVRDEVPKAETPGDVIHTREETDSDHTDDGSSTNNGFNALAKRTYDDRSKGKDVDSSFDSDSDGDSYDDSDSESGVDFFTRFQPRGGPVKSSTGKPAPKPTESRPNRPQKPATTETPSK